MIGNNWQDKSMKLTPSDCRASLAIYCQLKQREYKFPVLPVMLSVWPNDTWVVAAKMGTVSVKKKDGNAN